MSVIFRARKGILKSEFLMKGPELIRSEGVRHTMRDVGCDHKKIGANRELEILCVVSGKGC
jgi:hypothetical protein